MSLLDDFFARNGADADAFREALCEEAAARPRRARRTPPAAAEAPPQSVREMAARAAARDRANEQRQGTVRGTLLDGLRMTEDEYTTMLEGAHR